MIGLGAMIHYLGGGSDRAAADYTGRVVTAADIADDRLHLTFADGAQIAIWDNGQSCCEHRYMSTDDDLSSLVGGSLVRIDAKDGPTETGNYDDAHETCFVEVATTAGFVTLVNHNEHNGYYGGFGLTITEERAASVPADGAHDAPSPDASNKPGMNP